MDPFRRLLVEHSEPPSDSHLQKLFESRIRRGIDRGSSGGTEVIAVLSQSDITPATAESCSIVPSPASRESGLSGAFESSAAYSVRRIIGIDLRLTGRRGARQPDRTMIRHGVTCGRFPAKTTFKRLKRGRKS